MIFCEWLSIALYRTEKDPLIYAVLLLTLTLNSSRHITIISIAAIISCSLHWVPNHLSLRIGLGLASLIPRLSPSNIFLSHTYIAVQEGELGNEVSKRLWTIHFLDIPNPLICPRVLSHVGRARHTRANAYWIPAQLRTL